MAYGRFNEKMSSEKAGKKRSKSYYKKCAHGAKRARQGAHTLEPGSKGFLVMCNNNESGAVRESYNILNEYADSLYGIDQATCSKSLNNSGEEDDEDIDDDIEKALTKEVEEIKSTDLKPKRFQNVKTRAKNCIFIQSTVEDPVLVTLKVMEDIAANGLRKARFAARILPVIGTCKANVEDVVKLARTVLGPVFSANNITLPLSYTVLFKIRNNNKSEFGKNQVISAIQKTISEINPQVKFSWSDYQLAVLVEVVCTVCCLGVAPDYVRLRKYNLQELQQGPKVLNQVPPETDISKCNEGDDDERTESGCHTPRAEVVDTNQDSEPSIAVSKQTDIGESEHCTGEHTQTDVLTDSEQGISIGSNTDVITYHSQVYTTDDQLSDVPTDMAQVTAVSEQTDVVKDNNKISAESKQIE
ncbi:THUMP domain-containing protein 1 [Bulinus truncatus]|nr:THUMP domain-containing protein 1 [Bulinus truncatus]